jgi:Animal haem peroxidase
MKNWPDHDPKALEALAAGMKDSEWRRNMIANRGWLPRTAPSGYVYFGQFIDHDLTKDNRYLSQAFPSAEETPNFRTAQADLESLYGRVPADVPCLYEDDGERLKLGPTLPVTKRDGLFLPESFDDLPRSEKGKARIIDPRNDENLIVAQMHVLFIKFHNRTLELLRNEPSLAPPFSAGTSPSLFEQARRFVTWHYQWIVLHDFLKTMTRQDVYDDIVKAGSAPILFPRWVQKPLSVPVEFSVAAFRFGHSMVREGYIVNDHWALSGAEIVEMTERGGGLKDRLRADYVVDWKYFFYWSNFYYGSKINRARSIAASITEMMYDLPAKIEQLFRQHSSFGVPAPPPHPVVPGVRMMPPLPELTLKRGSIIGLPSGEEFAKAFGFSPVDPKYLFPNGDRFFKKGLNERTPLWYYVLREAEIEYDPRRNRQQTLGEIGSRIVAETLYRMLKSDPDSILDFGRNWKPPTFYGRQKKRRWCLASISELTEFIHAKD